MLLNPRLSLFKLQLKYLFVDLQKILQQKNRNLFVNRDFEIIFYEP